MAPSLDHIIIILPYKSLLRPPAWLTDNFTITPGGRHADGRTENRLICFRDGSYIELIAFINDDPRKRLGHWWDKDYGIVDFSFAYSDGEAVTHFSELEKRLKELEWEKGAVEVEYEKPQAGARVRPDGQEIEWQVTFPVATTGYQRGELPFFTHDITPRSLRVPFSEESLAHPSLAQGVKSLSNWVAISKFPALAMAYSAILEVPGLAAGEDSPELACFEVHGANGGVGGHKAKVCLQAPKKNTQLEQMERRGGSFLGDLVIGVSTVSAGTEGPKRIDTIDGGIGGVFLDLY